MRSFMEWESLCTGITDGMEKLLHFLDYDENMTEFLENDHVSLLVAKLQCVWQGDNNLLFSLTGFTSMLLTYAKAWL